MSDAQAYSITDAKLTKDVIICEDEPYYCLYTGEWTPKSHKSEKTILAQRQLEAEKKEGKEGQEAFLKALPPTYLTVDYQGRVIRMDVSLDGTVAVHPSLTSDLLQDVLPRLASRVVHLVAAVHRATYARDRGVHTGAQRLRDRHDSGYVPEVGL